MINEIRINVIIHSATYSGAGPRLMIVGLLVGNEVHHNQGNNLG